jgi:uncharacterized protein
LPLPEERLVEVAPGIKVRCCCYWHGERTAALTVIVVHGLEGSSESQYMSGVARNALAAGMNVVLMNQRNCGGMDHCAPTLYNSSLSSDVAAVAKSMVESDGVSRFALIGFSMGGNLVLKLAGEWAGAGPEQFKAVAAVCPAMDLAASADALHEPANRIYEYYFLMQLFRRFRTKAKLFPKNFDVARLRGVSTLRLFDDRVTAYYCGFAGADDYYARAAASTVVDRIAVPALIIHAANDPFIRVLPQTRERIAANPNITYVETADGGHCAFIGERNSDPPVDGGHNDDRHNDGLHNDDPGDDGRWAERQVVEFVKQFG